MLSAVYGIEYSLRIQALGTDFAYLVPDYETDLYLDPNILGEKKITGISWEHSDTPLVLRAITERFAWSGMYWGEYWYRQYPGEAYEKNYSIYGRDYWILDLRGKFIKFLTDEVWNFYNDGKYTYSYDFAGVESEEIIVAKLFPGASGSRKIGPYFKILSKVHAGIYLYREDDINSNQPDIRYEQWYIPVSIRLGLQYRNIHSYNNFSSFYFMAGGPTTTYEIDDLPYSVWMGMEEEEVRLGYFAHALIARFGFARGLALADRGMFIVGLRDEFLWQDAEDHISLYEQKRAFRNILAVPIAVEYNTGRITIRLGSSLKYTFKHYTIRDYFYPDDVIDQVHEHEVIIKRTFGIQWRMTDKFIVDTFHIGSLASLDSWKIYLKYEL
jgi:hypothetical protein